MPKAEMKKNLEQILSYKEMRFSILYFSSELPEFQHTHTQSPCTLLFQHLYQTDVELLFYKGVVGFYPSVVAVIWEHKHLLGTSILFSLLSRQFINLVSES